MYDRAIEDYNAALGINPNHAWAYTHRGLAYLTRGKADAGTLPCACRSLPAGVY
ncbi:MAG: tetratricopeptide repeat protein [Treponema sp.]|nr:tetratricopeptide repeat protein [Treponema sp.]